MSGKWFSNRGQILQSVIAFVALIVGILVAFPRLPVQQGFQGFVAVWPIIIFPLAALILMWLSSQRIHQAIETLAKKNPDVPATPAILNKDHVNAKAPSADPFSTRSIGPEHGWQITEAYVEDVRIKVGSYWDEPVAKNKIRISAVAIHEEPGRRAGELHIRTGGSLVFGGKQSEEISTNRYKITISRSGFDADERSIYQFSFSDEHIHIFIVRVDGLDTALNEIALQVAKLRVWKPQM